MSSNAVKILVFLVLILILTNHGFSEEARQIEMKLSVFPETVTFGDSCYALVTAFNHSKEMAVVTTPYFTDLFVNFDLWPDSGLNEKRREQFLFVNSFS